MPIASRRRGASPVGNTKGAACDNQPVKGVPVYVVAHYRTVEERLPPDNGNVQTNDIGEATATFAANRRVQYTPDGPVDHRVPMLRADVGSKPIAKLATSAVELAVKVGRRAPVIAKASTYNGRVDVPSVLLEVIVVTRENLQSTVVADGYLSYRDVYRYVVPPPER